MKHLFPIFFLLLSYTISAQIFGFGYQTTLHSNQFVISANIPYNGFLPKKENKPRIDCGIDFISADKDIFSGLYLKPATFVYDFNTSNSKKICSYVALSVEPAYLINNSKGTNGFTISPNVYFDFIGVYMKTGYEYHFNDSQSQVYVRAGIAIGYSIGKALKDVPISKI